MNEDLGQASRFIHHHLDGQAKSQALKGLKAFADGKVNCKASNRYLTTFSLNRDLLHTVVSKLHDNSLPLDLRKSCAANLFSSLGVCVEGEATHFQQAALTLSLSGNGFSEKLALLKQSVAEQNIQELVRAVKGNSMFLPAMEIHHVNGLLNRHAAEFGLTAFKDRYTSSDFVKEYALPAQHLLSEALSPQRLSWALAEQLGEFATANAQGLSEEFSTEKLSDFENALQQEWGGDWSLHDLLEISGDSGALTVKSVGEIQIAILQHLQDLGQLPAQSTPTQFVGKPPARIALQDLHGLCASDIKKCQAGSDSIAGQKATALHVSSAGQELLDLVKKRKKTSTPGEALRPALASMAQPLNRGA